LRLQGFFTLHSNVAQHGASILRGERNFIMICAAIGLGIIGAIAFHKARHCYRGCYAGWGYHMWHRWGHRHGLYMALAHLDATPAQERAIVAEVDQLKSRLWAARTSLRDARGDLAAAVRGSVLDDAALGAVLGRVDGATGEARGALLDALRNVHAILDDRQRERLADWLDRGWWRRSSGAPYRV
jgi:Spy/CpxP family protein refolding chaperone